MAWVFTDEQRFYLHEGESLLDGMIRTHHQDVRFMCRQGFCGACKMQVKAHTGYLLCKQTPLAQLKANEVLACCCVPIGSLAVSYQDVTSAQSKTEMIGTNYDYLLVAPRL